MLCLCEKGIPLSFPQFNIQLRPGSKISFPARTYMKIDSNICKLKLNPSPDEYWHFDLTLLEDTILYFDLKNSQIGIQRHQSPSNPSSDVLYFSNLVNTPSHSVDSQLLCHIAALCFCINGNHRTRKAPVWTFGCP